MLNWIGFRQELTLTRFLTCDRNKMAGKNIYLFPWFKL